MPEEDGVFIAYASIYGNTAKAAEKLLNVLTSCGVKAEIADLNRCDLSKAASTTFKYSKLVVASVTCDGGIMPCAETFINKLKAKNFCKRTVGFIENGSWAPSAAKTMRLTFESFKDISFCSNTVTVTRLWTKLANCK